MPTTIGEALSTATARLAPSSNSPRLDAEVLLCAALQCSRATLMAWPDRAIGDARCAAFSQLVDQRFAGTPIAYLLGEREFWSLPLKVTSDVLIPRPDTELLVEVALALVSADVSADVADLGTGSGAIALALANENPKWQIVATDASELALDVARENAERLALTKIEFIHGSWLDPLKGRQFDMIVSNPPYIHEDDPHLAQGDVRFEPISALTSPEQGLADIRAISAAAGAHLKPAGWLVLEHGYDQKEQVQAILFEHGYQQIETRYDLGGQPRVTLGRTIHTPAS